MVVIIAWISFHEVEVVGERKSQCIFSKAQELETYCIGLLGSNCVLSLHVQTVRISTMGMFLIAIE